MALDLPSLHLISTDYGPNQRKHLGLFVPKNTNEADPKEGNIIYVVGSPLAGYDNEFKRNYNRSESLEKLNFTILEGFHPQPWPT